MNSAIAFALETTKITRQNVITILSQFTAEQRNHIPEGFSNNLIWNFGHLIVTQQILTYSLAGVQPTVSSELIEKYRKGTKPTEYVDEAGFQELIQLSEVCLAQTEQDIEKGIFANYKTYTTSYGSTLTSVEDALLFNGTHEGLHFGFCLALKKMI